MYPLKPNEWGQRPFRRLRNEKTATEEKIHPARMLRKLISFPFTVGFTTVWMAYNIAAVSAMSTSPRGR